MNKKSKIATILVCLAAAAAILYVGLVPGATPGTDDPAAVGAKLGALTLLPPLLAVVLAFLTRDVIASLLLGFLSGAALVAASGAGGLYAGASQIAPIGLGAMLDTVTDRDNASIIILCLAIGGMVEVIRCSGGFEALARQLTRRINTPKRANLIGELLGVIVFFDDYANSLIVGPVMRPVTDKLGVSREKLAYLVDSTAAPVTGIAVISSWVAVEVAIIDEGFAAAGYAGEGYATFLKSIPFCFYCIFCLTFILISSLTDREYGPMLQAERRARAGQPLCPGYGGEDELSAESVPEKGLAKRIVVAVVPIVLLCVFAMIGFYTDGRAALAASGAIAAQEPFSLRLLALAFGSANTYYLVMEASLLGGAAAILLPAVFGLSSVEKGIAAWLRGASSLLMTVVILVLAWSLSAMVASLGTVGFVVRAISLSVPYYLVPSLIFISCCFISFSVGSYGCMFIAMPMAIPLAITVMERSPALAGRESFLLVCIASVLCGGIFGDHCSPITDCTILSSRGAGCDNMAHVRTQMPYALTIAFVSVAAGTLPAGFGIPFYVSLPLGLVLMTAILLIFGRSPGASKMTGQSK